MTERNAGESRSGGAVVAAFASTGVTLWLIGLLVVGMALGTVIPQAASPAAYQRAFGEALGGLIARGSLSNVYGSWWFIALFGLLWVNLLACVVQRVSLLARRQVRGAAMWGVVAAHCGVLVILAGAAYGRWPSRAYRSTAALRPGEQHAVPERFGGFAVRLLAAGGRRDEMGRPKDFWARAELIEGGRVLRTVTIRPNRPLRHKAISVVLQSLPAAGMAVEATYRGRATRVPIVLDEHGNVLIMQSMAKLPGPGWLAFVHHLREEGGRMEARVIIDRSGKISPNWERVGWVGPGGVEYKGVTFRLARAGQGAELSLDRDVGVPVVWVGFAVLTLGLLAACFRGKAKGSAEGVE